MLEGEGEEVIEPNAERVVGTEGDTVNVIELELDPEIDGVDEGEEVMETTADRVLEEEGERVTEPNTDCVNDPEEEGVMETSAERVVDIEGDVVTECDTVCVTETELEPETDVEEDILSVSTGLKLT